MEEDKMASKPKIKPNSNDAPAKAELKALIKDDIVGVKDWKSSKIAFFTGAGPIFRIFSSVSNNGAVSYRRTLSLWHSLFKSQDRNIPALDDPEKFSDPQDRFRYAAHVQQVTEIDMNKILINTYKAGYLYCVLLAMYIFSGGLSAYFWPTHSYVEFLSRFSLLPIFGALIFKNFYVNWGVRYGVADKPARYFKSRDWLPKKVFQPLDPLS